MYHGLGVGQGALVAKLYGLKVTPEILKRFLDGRLSAEQAARKMEERVETKQGTIKWHQYTTL